MGRLTWHTDLDKYNDRKSFDFVLGVFLSPVRAPTDGALWCGVRCVLLGGRCG
jgi:hypothetical protein